MRSRATSIIVAVILLANTTSFADTVVGAPGTGTTGNFGNFGGQFSTATYGQTFVTPGSDNVLKSFTFYFDDVFANGGSNVSFKAYVMAWGGDRATGSILWNSATATSTNNHGAGGLEAFTFNPNVSLTPGVDYVAFFNSSDYYGSPTATGYSLWNFTNGAPGGYAPGKAVFYNNTSFSQLTTTAWDGGQGGTTGYPNGDFKFDMTFGASAVPLPSAAYAGMALMLVVGLNRLRHVRDAAIA